MGPSGRITHVIGYIALFGTSICRFSIWVELPIQRRLCPIFVRNVGSSDIHECFRGLTGSQRTPGLGRHSCDIKFRRENRKARRLCHDGEVLCHENHNKMLREQCCNIDFYCFEKG